MRKIMTDEEYEGLIAQVAVEFHDKYMKNPNKETNQNLDIAVEYTTFVLSTFSKLVEEFDGGQTKSD
jgi:hypothetical protein